VFARSTELFDRGVAVFSQVGDGFSAHSTVFVVAVSVLARAGALLSWPAGQLPDGFFLWSRELLAFRPIPAMEWRLTSVECAWSAVER
jgi:hypothetical protein